jgi:hypothetical protein
MIITSFIVLLKSFLFKAVTLLALAQVGDSVISLLFNLIAAIFLLI